MLNKIIKLCKQKGLTICELERMLGFGNGTIRKWDNAKPSIDKVKSVADYFGIYIDELICSPSFPNPKNISLASQMEGLNDEQLRLVECYISLIKTKQIG